MIRRRASVPIAENMSAYLTTFSIVFLGLRHGYISIVAELWMDSKLARGITGKGER